VNSCQYWDDDQFCHADQIWVRNDIMGYGENAADHLINATDVEFGKEFEAEGKGQSHVGLSEEVARTSPQTCCDTMRPKSK
jgi:hypothetical protein